MTDMRRWWWIGVIAVGLLVVACEANDDGGAGGGADVVGGADVAGAGDVGGGEEVGTAFLGLYRVDSWLLNQGACEAGGAPVLADGQSWAFGVVWDDRYPTLFDPAVVVAPCSDEADCVRHLDAGRSGTALGLARVYVLTEGDDAAGWGGVQGTPTPLLDAHWWSDAHGPEGEHDGQCRFYLVKAALTAPAEGRLRFELRYYLVDVPPGTTPSGDPGCVLSDALAAVDQGTCVGFESLDAVYEKPLVIPPEEGDGG